MMAVLFGACAACSPLQEEADPQLLVFMSFSVPLPSWQAHSAELERRGGAFVLRGLPEDSFAQFASKMKELREAGVRAPVDIDPEAFERYGVDAVPVIVKAGVGKAVGNIPIEQALERMR